MSLPSFLKPQKTAQFPFPSIPTENIIQILKKCNDESFVNMIRSCRRMYDTASKIGKESRIFCHSYVVAFVYFDEKKKEVMFDVTGKKEQGFWSRTKDHLRSECGNETRFEYRYPRLRKFIPKDNLLEMEEKSLVFLGFPPKSRLILRRSHRSLACHRKMTAEQLSQALKFFRFATLEIDPNNEMNPTLYPTGFLILEEILKIIPILRARTLILHHPNNNGFLGKILNQAEEGLQIKELLFHYSCYEYAFSPPRAIAAFGYIEEWKVDWHSLEGLAVPCLEENFKEFYEGFIKKWESGQTNLKYLRLHVDDAPQNWEGPDLPVETEFLKFYYYDWDIFHYHYSVCNNKWAIIFPCRLSNILYFFDISDCDGCDCQTEFCFQKLIDVLSKFVCNFCEKRPVDWGPVLDEWQTRDKSMAHLGLLIKKVWHEPNSVTHKYCCY